MDQWSILSAEGALGAAEAIAVGALPADEAPPEPDAAGGAGVVTLNTHAYAAGPHGVFAVEAGERGFQVRAQRANVVLRAHIHGVAVFGVVVEAADDRLEVAFGGHGQSGSQPASDWRDGSKAAVGPVA